MTAAPVFEILAVCTGNVCRSPAVERLVRALDVPGLSISSAGTNALVGKPIDPDMAARLRRAGASVDGFSARQLEATMIRNAGLIVTAEISHRSAVLRIEPGAVNRVFTLRELARVCLRLPNGACDPADLPALVDLAARSRRAPETPRDDDIPDPYGRGRARYNRSMELTESAVAQLTAIWGAR